MCISRKKRLAIRRQFMYIALATIATPKARVAELVDALD